MIVTIVPQEAIDFMWPQCEPHLSRAVERASEMFDVSDIYLGAKMGYYGLWVVMEGEQVIASYSTRMVSYPKRKALVIDFMGGDRLNEWLPQMVEVTGDFAKLNGCSNLEAYGRHGWKRPLAKLNWTADTVCYNLELNNE